MTEIITLAEFKKLKPKKSKYKAKKTEFQGIKFDSLKECARYKNLLILKKAGNVVKIELQPRYDIIVNGIFCGFYKADFKVYYSDGRIDVEDVKGMRTTVYSLKKKIIEALYSIKIIEM